MQGPCQHALFYACPEVTSVLLLHAPDPGAPDLAADFRAAGFEVRGSGECAQLVRETLRAAPDVLVCWAPRPGTELPTAIALLQAQQPLPVLLFTQDSAAEPMQRALEAGVHAWVVQGYARERVRPLVQLAQARFARELALRTQLAELGEKLDERKWVDKAKGILMRARQVSEDEAFQLLRKASMQGQQRVGQLSRQVIDAARVAEGINRAGQQRMLSQRLVKLHALGASRTEVAAVAVLLRESLARVEENLGWLESNLSTATYGDLLDAARAGWLALRSALEAGAASLPQLDELADAVLAQADALVLALQSSGLAAQVGVINVAGRQRMLAQRMAKQALLQAEDAAVVETAAAFEEGMARLAEAPLSTPEIRALLERGEAAWQQLRGAVGKSGQAAGRMKLAAASEELLEVFDRLTEAYQHSIQVLMGA